MLKKLNSLVPDLLLCGGATAVSVGAWMIYAPAGWVVAGLLLMVAGWIMARSQ
jgi:hypothetical protein